jgi:hypothetical protein
MEGLGELCVAWLKYIFQRHNLHFDVNTILYRYSPIAKKYKINHLDTQAYVTKRIITFHQLNAFQLCPVSLLHQRQYWTKFKGFYSRASNSDVAWGNGDIRTRNFYSEYHSSLNHRFGNSGARQGHNVSYLDWQNSRTLLRVSDNSLI